MHRLLFRRIGDNIERLLNSEAVPRERHRILAIAECVSASKTKVNHEH